MTNTRSARQRLLDTAAQIVARQGVQELTLDGVAAAAGVTKGGLIYHFKTKDDLLGALVEQLVAEIEQRQRAKAATYSGDTRGTLLTAMVDDTFDMPRGEKELLANLLSAVFSHPHLLGPAQEMYTRVYGELAEASASDGLALTLAAALDGITLLEVLNLHSFTKRQREAMRMALLQLVQNLS